jgi:hypothetical protein
MPRRGAAAVRRAVCCLVACVLLAARGAAAPDAARRRLLGTRPAPLAGSRGDVMAPGRTTARRPLAATVSQPPRAVEPRIVGGYPVRRARRRSVPPGRPGTR